MDVLGLQAWARIGACQLVWYEERSADGSFMSGPEISTLLGMSNAWTEEEGIWG